MENITLYYREGSSDKVYQAALESQGGGYVVTFAYGRRGTALATGTKTHAPVTYDEAKTIYERLVREKTAKGYTPGADGTPYQHSDKQASGILPQLLNAIDVEQLTELLKDMQHVMQEKYDGRRLLIQKNGITITGINKLGVLTGFPAVVAEELQVAEADFLIDGEIVGEEYHAFDLLELDGEDLRGSTYGTRYLHLMNLLASFNHRHISLVESIYRPDLKEAKFHELKARNKEGVVFKRHDAIYTAGRPNSGGPQLKFKFHETASFIVTKVNGKRSVSLMLFDGDKVLPIGNVTIPPNHEVPKIGAIVEVRYLYAYRGGSIFQPVYLGVRDDIRAEECQLSQLKYKAEPACAAA